MLPFPSRKKDKVQERASGFKAGYQFSISNPFGVECFPVIVSKGFSGIFSIQDISGLLLMVFFFLWPVAQLPEREKKKGGNSWVSWLENNN